MPIERNDIKALRANIDPAKRKALEAVGLALIGQAQKACPVGKYPKGSGRKGGNLRRSHKYRVQGETVIVGATAEYAGYVHNGTSRQAAQPWLKNAAEQNRNALGRLFVQTMKGGMQ